MTQFNGDWVGTRDQHTDQSSSHTLHTYVTLSTGPLARANSYKVFTAI